MTKQKYTVPACEHDSQWELAGLLADSNLIDDGAGGFLGDGDDFTF